MMENEEPLNIEHLELVQLDSTILSQEHLEIILALSLVALHGRLLQI